MFFLGLFIGAIMGVVVMCLLAANNGRTLDRDEDQEMYIVSKTEMAKAKRKLNKINKVFTENEIIE